MTYQAASRPFMLFRFALREGDFRLAKLIAHVLRHGRRRRPCLTSIRRSTISVEPRTERSPRMAFDPERFVATVPWRFAKTMAHIPHYYTLEGETPEEDFWAFVRHIRRHGYLARWRHLAANSYLELGEWKYWTLPASQRDGRQITIINRERLPGQPIERVPGGEAD